MSDKKRSMLGGRRYKTIREVETVSEADREVGAIDVGEDLVVSKKVFDAFEDAVKRAKREQLLDDGMDDLLHHAARQLHRVANCIQKEEK